MESYSLIHSQKVSGIPCDEQKLFKYVKKKKITTIHLCSKSLQMKEIEVLSIFNHLLKIGKLRITSVPLSNINNCSCYYSAI